VLLRGIGVSFVDGTVPQAVGLDALDVEYV